MKHALDNALTAAEPLALVEDGDTADFLYDTVRKCLVSALELAKTLEEREPLQAIEWALCHFPKDLHPDVRITINGPRLDPRVHPDCSAQGRARWLLETQGERLMAAAVALRTATDREVEHGWTWADLRARLMEIPGMTAQKAGNWKKRGGLVGVAPDVYTAKSCEACLARAGKPRKGRDNVEEYDPLEL